MLTAANLNVCSVEDSGVAANRKPNQHRATLGLDARPLPGYASFEAFQRNSWLTLQSRLHLKKSASPKCPP